MAHKNRIGNIFSLTSFGESHGRAVGGVIDGMPAGVKIDMQQLQHEVNRRRPGVGTAVSTRKEDDVVEILSGVMDGTTLGTPIGFFVANIDHRPEDYNHLKDVFRPSHADFTYQAKYGIRDHRGGGRASARETVARVVAGAIAKQALAQLGISIEAHASSIGGKKLSSEDNLKEALKSIATGDTAGGVVTCTIHGVPAGIGEPVFGKLSSQLAEAMMSIPAAKGFELGAGFEITNHPGSEVLDNWLVNDRKIGTTTNFSGGIQGGISNGNDIVFNVAFKPVATLMQPVQGVDTNGNMVTIEPRGRHDACVVPRAVPVVEAMAAIVTLDNMLMARASRL